MMQYITLNIQDIVDSYDDPAVLISDEYIIIKANAAYLERYHLDTQHVHGLETAQFGGSLASGAGRSHCFEISHRYSRSCDQEGESCPLQLAKSTSQRQRVLHVHHTRYGEEHVDVSLFPIRDNHNKLYFLEVMKTIKHASPRTDEKGLVGKSPAFNHLVALINRVAGHEISVLLQGESGTGKELVAHAVHQASDRSSSACVTVECSGLSESLFESELFGHEKGAFTGAVNRKKGLVEEAEGGTLFLDEIGDVPLSLQVKLLRLIETRTFRRVGGVEQLTADFRLICATHKNLQEMVKRGEFREDLYYRISTFPVDLPSLRERKMDIPLLVETILERIAKDKKIRVSEDVLAFFQQYSFPGNIRQLRNILEYGRVLADANIIEMAHLPKEILSFETSANSEVKPDTPPDTDLQNAPAIVSLEQHERKYLLWLSEHFQGDNKKLADKLGVSERTLYRKMKSFT